MVRCSKCFKTVKSHMSPSWDEGVCPACWNPKPVLQFAPEKLTRIKTNPVDVYLDYWTEKELISTGN